METLLKHGSFELVKYQQSLFAIEFNNEYIGITIKSFSDKESALTVFNNVIKPLSAFKAGRLNDNIRKSIVYSN